MKKYPIITLSGIAGSGKSTVADCIVEVLGFNDSFAMSMALADPLKRLVSLVFGVSPSILYGPSSEREKPIEINWGPIMPRVNAGGFQELIKRIGKDEVDLHFKLTEIIKDLKKQESVSARTILQTIGTDFARKNNPDVWTNWGLETAKSLVTSVSDIVVVSDCRFRNEILKFSELNSVSLKIKRNQESKSTHVSETELDTIPDWFFDEIIDNNGSLESLYKQVEEVLAKYYGIFKKM